MKVTITNVKHVLSALHINASKHFIIEKSKGSVYLTICTNCNSYNYDLNLIERALNDNFECTYRRDKKGYLHMIILNEKHISNDILPNDIKSEYKLNKERKGNMYLYTVTDNKGNLIGKRTSKNDYVACTINCKFMFGRVDLIGRGSHLFELKRTNYSINELVTIAYLSY